MLEPNVEIRLGDVSSKSTIMVIGSPGSDMVGGPVDVPGRLVALYPANTSTFTIGRDPESDLLVDDLTVSREHAEIRLRVDGSREIVDLSSSNGTFVNGLRIQAAILQDLDLVQIGNLSFRLIDDNLEAYTDDRRPC